MTTLATIGLSAAYSWTISIGGGWIVVMLIGMGLCFVGMLSFMWLMRDGQGWAMCGQRRLQETPLAFREHRRGEHTGPLDDDKRKDVFAATTGGVRATESEA